MSDETDIELEKLRDEVVALNTTLRAQVYAPVWKRAWISLISGLFFGLGSVLGASLLVSLLIYTLSSIDFIPILGDWAQQIIDQINAGNAK